MTTKERLREFVDELSELEAGDALRLLEAHRADNWWANEPVAPVADAATLRHLDRPLTDPERDALSAFLAE